MTEHIEWADASYSVKHIEMVNPEDVDARFYPADAFPSSQYLLAIDTGSSIIAINGTPAELFDFAKALLLATLPIQPGYPGVIDHGQKK